MFFYYLTFALRNDTCQVGEGSDTLSDVDMDKFNKEEVIIATTIVIEDKQLEKKVEDKIAHANSISPKKLLDSEV